MGKPMSPAVKWLLALGVGGGLLLLVCCCGIGGFITWLLGPGWQVPTLSIAAEQSALILHGTPNPNDSGAQDLLGYVGELMQQA